MPGTTRGRVRWRVVLLHGNGREDVRTMSRTLKTERRALSAARAFAADLGEHGSITLQQNVGTALSPDWADVRRAIVSNSVAGPWK